MDRQSARYLRTLEELKDAVCDLFNNTLDDLDKQFKDGDFKKLSIGMAVVDDAGKKGIVIGIRDIHDVQVQYNEDSRIETHCMDTSCFHYDPVHHINLEG